MRTHAEYVVSLLQPAPNKMRGGLSLNGCEGEFDATRSPAEQIVFTYSSTRHLELRFLREDDLLVLAKQIFDEQTTRQCSASAADVLAYGKEKLGQGDDEWVRACEARPKWKKILGKP